MNTTWKVLALALGTSVIGCGGGPGPTEPPPPPPITLTATVSASPSSGFAPLTTNITISAGGTAKGPASYFIDFGDGTAPVNATANQGSYTATHVYQSGTYTVSVRVERDELTATAATTVTAKTIAPVGARSPEDRPDEAAGRQIKPVYFTCVGGPDRGLDTTGVLQNSVGSFQNWFAGKTGRVLRQDTYQGKLDILYFASSMTCEEIAAVGAFVVNELYRQLVEAGFNDPDKRYLIYYDGLSTYACGGAIVDGQAAAMYLRAVLPSGTDCGAAQFVTSSAEPPKYWEFAMIHDSWHVGGCVDPQAPDHYAPNPYGVNNSADLMHHGPGGWNPSAVDTTGQNWFGDNVLSGVRNCKLDSILIPAPASIMAGVSLQMDALRASPQEAIPTHIHELVRKE